MVQDVHVYEEARTQGRWDAQQVAAAKSDDTSCDDRTVLAYSYYSWNNKATLQHERSTGRLSKPYVRDVRLPKVG
jgi:hypothetical protein